MTCSTHSRLRRLWLLAATVAMAAAMPTTAAVLTWPGPSPCNAALQACIAAATSGDIVEVASNGPITESVEIFQKSLTLRAATGFSPVLDTAPSLDAIEAFGSDAVVAVTIEGMTVRGAFIGAYQGGSGAFSVQIHNNKLEADGLDSNLSGINVATFGSSPTGPVDLVISNNEIALGFLAGDDISAIRIGDFPGHTTGLIMANTVTHGGTASTLSAITLHNGIGTAEFDLRYNRVTASGYNGGILLRQDGSSGTMIARIVNNLVTGTIDYTGPQPGAISLLANAGNLQATVLSNTLAGNDTGFIASVASGATLGGVLANTLVTANTNQGVVIGAAAAVGFSNESNLVFGNGSNDFIAGPGTIQADPRVVGAGDFHPRSDSPVRDAGTTALAADIPIDLDGAPRVIGPAIDIGAWELGDSIFVDGFDS
ncbi:MAG: choice-of-anchor Q domain-containing protein [Dokdonella sp.]|uniref:choice-of-anchor Q domain-containing protein n=1 Tax=Dokdonella sp. TaxID=2291710 RepID=UPI0032632986